MPALRPSDRRRFAECAALPAIEDKLRKARRHRADADREVRWLEDLLAERQRQVEAGTWPTQSGKDTDHG